MSESKEMTLEEKLVRDAGYFGARNNVRTERLLELLYTATCFGFDANKYDYLWEAAYTNHNDQSIIDWLYDGNVDVLFK